MGQIYGEMDQRACKRRGDEGRLNWVKSNSGKVIKFKLAPKSHYIVLSGQTCPVKKRYYIT